MDALTLEAVVRTNGELELLDRQREVRGEGGVRGGRAHVDALGVDVELASQTEQLDQGLTGRRHRVADGLACLVSTSTISLSKSVRCSTRVASTLYVTFSTGE